MFKLAVLNRERDIDKVWRDWNVYCFEEKKKNNRSIIAILKTFTVSAVLLLYEAWSRAERKKYPANVSLALLLVSSRVERN